MKQIPCKVVQEKDDQGVITQTLYPVSPIPLGVRVVIDGTIPAYIVCEDKIEEKQLVDSKPTLKECVDAQTPVKVADPKGDPAVADAAADGVIR